VPRAERSFVSTVTRAAPWLFALAGALVARAVARLSLGDVPHVMDEIAYRLQALTFAHGHLEAPLHLPRAAFAMWYVDDHAATVSIFPPGWPAVLALPARLGLAEWVNPGLHFATALVAGDLARRLGGGPRARVVAAAAYALSPQAILLAASLMSHTLVALLAALALWPALGPPRRSWIGGAALGLLVLTRPLCAVVVAVAALAVLVLVARRRALRAAAGFALPALVGCALLGAYNRALTGSAARFPQTVYFDEHLAPLDDAQFHYHPGCNDLGFGAGHGCDYGIPNATHTVANALSNTGDNLTAWLLLAGGGPIVFALFVFAFVRARRRRRLAAVAAAVPAAVLLYALYWYAGTCFGARFYHAALVSLVAVATCGFVRAPRSVRVAAAGAWLLWNIIAVAGGARELSHAYWGTDARFERFARGWGGDDALVMVAFRNARLPERPTYFWTSFLKQAIWRNSVRANAAVGANDPFLAGRVVFAKFHPALVAELRERFPSRRLFLYVVEDDRPDTLAPYDEPPADAPRPPDNFDAWQMPSEPPPAR
jgi:hypothetical protein